MQWQIRDKDNVLAETKQQVHVYAIKNKLTIAQALAELIKIALNK